MGGFGDFNKGEKRKMSKEEMKKKANKSMNSTDSTAFVLPKIIEKKKGGF